MIQQLYALWHKFFGPDLGRALAKFEKAASKFDEVANYEAKQVELALQRIKNAEAAKALAEANKARALKVGSNFKSLIEG